MTYSSNDPIQRLFVLQFLKSIFYIVFSQLKNWEELERYQLFVHLVPHSELFFNSCSSCVTLLVLKKLEIRIFVVFCPVKRLNNWTFSVRFFSQRGLQVKFFNSLQRYFEIIWETSNQRCFLSRCFAAFRGFQVMYSAKLVLINSESKLVRVEDIPVQVLIRLFKDSSFFHSEIQSTKKIQKKNREKF